MPMVLVGMTNMEAGFQSMGATTTHKKSILSSRWCTRQQPVAKAFDVTLWVCDDWSHWARLYQLHSETEHELLQE
eukprot:COSAG06_NODE_47895_length_336_cov_0.628692_1_plen_74_part_01